MTGAGRSVYSVGQVNSYIRQLFQTDLVLSRISVRGEISNCRYHTSGHIYFSLKDENGQIRCVMFASGRRTLTFRLQDGQKVVVSGSISVYERNGEYQLYAASVRLDGIGALYEQYERLKKSLAEMGMFDPMYKKSIPRYIRTLGVVTAPTGAAVRDIINVSKRRNPGIRILLYPAQVQGEGAAQSIVRGLKLLDGAGCDTIIVGRGGGSIEDLWAFNEEIVAQAIFDMRTPVISAVGHETDFTIADYVADMRAPTPSAAAELAVDDMLQVRDALLERRRRLAALMGGKLELTRRMAESCRLKLEAGGPGGRLRSAMQDLDHTAEKMTLLMTGRVRSARERAASYALRLDISSRLEKAGMRAGQYRTLLDSGMQKKLQESEHRARVAGIRLHALSPEAGLERGYAYVQTQDGRGIASVKDISEGEVLRIRMKDGRIRAKVLECRSGEQTGEKRDGEC